MGNRGRIERPKLRDRERPGRQEFEEHCFERIVNLIDFIDEEHARLFLLDCLEQRARHEERPARDLTLDFPQSGVCELLLIRST